MRTHSVLYEPQQLYIEFGEEDDQYFFNTESQIEHISQQTIKISNLPSYLTNDKVIVIDSIHSGTGRTQEKDIYSKVISHLFEKLSIPHEIYRTKSPISIIEYAKDLQADKNITVIFISGDSSINEFINGLSRGKQGNISIFPIPRGTGNSLALSLDINDPFEAIIRLLQGIQLPLYLYEVEFPRGSQYLVHDKPDGEVEQYEEGSHREGVKFLVVFSWAFHASLVADSDTPELRKHGLERFQIAAMQNLNRDQKYEGNMYISNKNRVGEELILGPFAYWLLVSSLRFEPTFEISPEGDILNNELYLVAFNTKDPKDYILNIMKQVYDKGSHVNNPDVVYKRLGRDDKIVLKVKNSKSLIQRRFCLDGRIVALPETDDHEITIRIQDNTKHSWKVYIIH